MWIVAGVLLGLVVLISLVGFHTGPHTHLAAGVMGLLAAAWLVLMAADGRSAPILWALLSADLVVSAGVGVMAGYGLKWYGRPGHPFNPLEGAEGVALGDLAPEGIVKVRGEDWSAVAVNGNVPAGAQVHVVRAAGVRLEVWSEDAHAVPAKGMFRLDEGDSKGDNT
ncbi:MAG TPA: NfeD family protein [Acidimicrobiales bacterium]|nr:NfeD family protein [Acidimicrobiales bacterium]